MARKILLADDSVTAQNMGRKILADAGYEVIAVNNGSAALKKIVEIRPDVVVLDIYMPGYSGLEVCQRLKESPDTARIPVLLTVGKLEPFKPEEAQRVRAEAFIVKPFEASELLSALSKLEDKVVPRPEPSRPGRFARTMAAVDGGRAGAEEPSADNGWKNRIRFPHEKSEEELRAEEAEQRDQQKFVEQSTEYKRRKEEEAKLQAPPESRGREAETVDVAALSGSDASASLPKDVSQEEVSAIAAAASQMQATAAGVEQNRAAEPISSVVEPSAVQSSSVQSSAIQPSSTEALASASREEASEPVEEKAFEDRDKTRGKTGIETHDVPVTMAVAAESSQDSTVPRWTAVPVALDKEEAAVSLHEEMQKAFARDSSAAQASALASDSVSSAPEFSVQPSLAPVDAEEGSHSQAHRVPAEIQAEAASAAGSGPPLDPSPVNENMAAAKAEFEQPQSQASAVSPAEAQSAVPASADPAPAIAGQGKVSAEVVVSGQEVLSSSEKAQPLPETETIRSTAEAWASWSQSHEVSPELHAAEPTQQPEVVPAAEAPPETNAAAVAAGAEQLLQAATNGQKDGNPADVASIVDSVLAGLRPKLMEEISRKMSEKK